VDEHTESQGLPPPVPDVSGSTPAAPDAASGKESPGQGKRRSLLGDLSGYVRQFGRDVVSVTLGRLVEPSEKTDRADEVPPATNEQAPLSDSAYQRVHVLHDVAQKLRGAADKYITVKLDEIEARVDAKLDHIEERIDHKIVEVHEQLREMRDRELRHRLRLLKITLIFTVLVALLSLGYKWLQGIWFG
jgi:hypothetical protein